MNIHKVWSRNIKEGIDINGRAILTWTLGKWGLGMRIGFIWLKTETGGRHLCACYNESSGSITCGEFTDQLNVLIAS
jgi:hypothetical protein